MGIRELLAVGAGVETRLFGQRSPWKPAVGEEQGRCWHRGTGAECGAEAKGPGSEVSLTRFKSCLCYFL